MEIRAMQDGKAKKLVGYAATYNRISKVLYSRSFGYFREKILPGAFDGAVRNKNCPAGCECKSCNIIATLNHDENLVLGRVGAGTLKLKADDNGLRFEVTLPDTTYANDLYENVRAGNMTGCSFAFSSDDVDDEWDNREGDGNEISTGAFDEGRGLLAKVKDKVKSFLVRTIKKFRALKDVSIVSDPAYTGTSVSARSLAAACEVRSRAGLAAPTREDHFKRNPGLSEDAGRRARALDAAIHLTPTWPGFDADGLVEIILEARKLAAKPELNTIEHRRFWFCVSAITDIKGGHRLENLEINYRNALLAFIN